MKAMPKLWANTTTAYDGITIATRNASRSSLAPNRRANEPVLAECSQLDQDHQSAQHGPLARTRPWIASPSVLAGGASEKPDSSIKDPSSSVISASGSSGLSATDAWDRPIVAVKCHASPDQPMRTGVAAATLWAIDLEAEPGGSYPSRLSSAWPASPGNISPCSKGLLLICCWSRSAPGAPRH